MKVDKTKFIPTLNKVLILKEGESFVLTRVEWPSDYTPSTFLQRVAKKHKTKYSYKRTTDDAAWEITRIQ